MMKGLMRPFLPTCLSL
ncbi:hypothetical protein OIU78_030458, partial [Salix suchowensis]